MKDQSPLPARGQALIESGLTVHQAKVYETLVINGTLTASKASLLAGVPRTLGYKALGELVAFGLVQKDDKPGTVAQFTAAHPLKLKELADKRYTQAKDAKQALESVLGKLISEFNTVAGAPGLRVLEGISGIAELYEDELNERQPIKLIRTPKDDSNADIQKMILKQIAEQVKLGITVRVIAPHNPRTDYKYDKERLIERRILPHDVFDIPAQIAIYGNKVALTSYDPLITTLIENIPIRQTFEIIFEFMWKLSEQIELKQKEAPQPPPRS